MHKPASEQPVPLASSSSTLQGERPQATQGYPILFVDDEMAIQKAFERTSMHAGWQVTLAANANDALSKLQEQSFFVVISDFCMPGMDGVELLATVRELAPDTERILMTAFADEETLERAVNQAGISRFLRKPWRRHALQNIVESALAQARLRRDNQTLMTELEHHAQKLADANRLLADRVIAGDAELVRVQHQSAVALNAISDPVVIVDTGLQITFGNQAAARLAGAETGNLLGQQCHRALFAQPSPCPGCPISTGQGHVQVQKEGQNLSFRARSYPLPEQTPKFLCVYNDTTQEETFQREAAKVDKLAAIGRLASGIAHELNNPLHAIMSFAQLAQRPNVTGESLARYHEVILDCSKRCRDIINSLRSFSRQPVHRELKPVQLVDVCEKAMVLFEPRNGVALDYHNQALDAVVLGSANELQQVLVNLIQNALDASPANTQVKISVQADKGSYLVAVDDAGPGIPDQHRANIFEPFFTTKPEGQGTGLGLAICHAFVRQHDGSLEITNSSLGGARFELRLPAYQESVPSDGGGE